MSKGQDKGQEESEREGEPVRFCRGVISLGFGSALGVCRLHVFFWRDAVLGHREAGAA